MWIKSACKRCKYRQSNLLQWRPRIILGINRRHWKDVWALIYHIKYKKYWQNEAHLFLLGICQFIFICFLNCACSCLLSISSNASTRTKSETCHVFLPCILAINNLTSYHHGWLLRRWREYILLKNHWRPRHFTQHSPFFIVQDDRQVTVPRLPARRAHWSVELVLSHYKLLVRQIMWYAVHEVNKYPYHPYHDLHITTTCPLTFY